MYLVTLLFLFDTLHTVVTLNYAALFPEMYTTLADRAQMSSWRQIFAVIGAALGIALPPVLYATFGWGAFALFIGVVTAVTLYISLFGSHERARQANQDALPLRAALKATFRNRSFAAYMGMQVMLQFAFLLIMAVIPFYAKYVLNASEEITSLLLGATLVVAGILLLGWGRIATREWHLYLVLHDSYVLDEPNRQVMSRLYISEGTFNRTRRRALRALAKALAEYEAAS
ncbi:MAG: MFS transporter [Chloroflexi bacterium]|nr:MFS transporter [Chloroflexota bacterium]